ncbi:MAG: FtsX-like permease family protein [Saprospiraceae bacterium]|nr:ABC transporter permease [Lewinella sp.]
MSTNLKISWTHLTSRFRQLLVAVLSVTFGISMYIFMNSFMAGVNNAQTEISFTSMAHIKIYNDLPQEVPVLLPKPSDQQTVVFVNNARNIRYSEGIKNTTPILETLSTFAEVSQITQQLNQNVFFRNGVTRVSGNLSGIIPESEDQLFHTSEYLVGGDLYELDRRPDGIILGIGLAEKIGVKNGDNISLLTPEGVSKIFRVVGIIETGAAGADKSRALISIATARQLFSKNRSYATEILVNVQDYNQAKEVAQLMAPSIAYKVEPWQEGNSQLDSANVLRDILAIAVSLTILIVAGFGIYNIMNMTVNEKIKEIAILKAMGFNGRDIVQIFLFQSVVIGFVGGLVGLLLGYLISRLIDNVPFKIATLTTLPIEFDSSDYFLAFLFGIIITFIAGYLPARNASRVDPVEIIRG